LNEEPHPSRLIFLKQLHSSATIKMPGGGVVPVSGTTDVNRVEAPVTVRAYLIVAFAAFGGIFFGYDTGWMGGVLNMDYFIKQYTGHDYPDVVFPNVPSSDPRVVAYRNEHFSISSSNQSLVTSILSAGTFFGAIIAGDLADFIGRRFTIILGCFIFSVGGILETASTGLGVMTAGRLIAGFGVGFISAIVILYMSEIAPKKVRGAVVAGKCR
jgi:MFS family permease|tara:strand:+ start:14518 stop:15156 length:639 start_codon:yes stop_codon:yes gene_type:complete